MTEEQIKHMVDRFLSWKLPENFRPDGGVQFDADAAKRLDARNLRYEPYGTNLLDARQAESMIRYLVAGLPIAADDAEGLTAELRARANARHTGEEPSPTAQLCARAADRIEALEAENFKLAAGVCHWVTGNEHGNAYCGDTGKLL